MNSVKQVALEKSSAEQQDNLRRRHLIQKLAFGVLWVFGGIAVVILLGVTVFVFIQALAFFVGPESLTDEAELFESNGDVRAAVAETPYAIGYLSFGYLNDSVKALKLNGVAPTQANAADGDYYVVRPLNLITSKAPSAATQAWLNYVFSEDSQGLIASRDYVPVEAEAPFPSVADDVTGEVTVMGSTSVYPVAVTLASQFMQRYPGVTVKLEAGEASGGVQAAAAGEVDVGMTSRALTKMESEMYENVRVFQIAGDGIAIVANPNVSVDSLSILQVREIFSGKIDNWKDVGGPDAEIVVVAREEGAGIRVAFEEWVMGKGALISKGLRALKPRRVIQGVYGVVRSGWNFLTTAPRGGLEAKGGMSTTIVATLYLVMLTIIIATPLGVGAGIYLVEYAGEMQGTSGWQATLVSVIRFGVETLAGVPSIIFGLFGYALFVAALRFGFSMIAAALAGACLVLPVIIRTTEESLLTVPRAYREGSLALGSTQWQTIWRVVLPAALPGIITGIVLSVGRIVSETAVFYVTLGGSYHLPPSPLTHPKQFLTSGGRTMALHLYYLANDTAAFDKAMGTGAVLVISIILINLVINYLSHRLNQSLRGN
jgi:phosphate transport system permease protein